MKRILGQFVFLFIFISVFFAPLRAAESVLHPVDLRCEYLKNPLGIDRLHPRLSWNCRPLAMPGAA